MAATENIRIQMFYRAVKIKRKLCVG